MHGKDVAGLPGLVSACAAGAEGRNAIWDVFGDVSIVLRAGFISCEVDRQGDAGGHGALTQQSMGRGLSARWHSALKERLARCPSVGRRLTLDARF